MHPTRRSRRASLLPILACLLTACEGGLDPTPNDGSPPGRDVVTPFPIDRGDDGVATPGKYKGLWLRLVDTGQPVVTDFESQVGVVCIGMIDSAFECGDFIARINSHWQAEVSGSVRVLNCGRPGYGIEHWIDPAHDFDLWDACRFLLMPYLGMRPEQIRVVYHQAGNTNQFAVDGSPLPAYPQAGSNYERLYDNLTAFSQRVTQFFPNLQAVYTSSQSYGGFGNAPGRGEPLTYEEGHAVNSWLRDRRPVDDVWYGWGAYVWAPPCPSDVMNAAGVCYFESDYEANGIQMTGAGRGKVSWQIHQRLLLEDWYRR